MGELICGERLDNDRRITLHKGDITKERVDAIVNAANSHLAHGGGVAGAIVRAGGDMIQEESNRIVRDNGPVPVGGAVATGPGRLPCKAVIHTVGPRWGEGREDDKLRDALLSVYQLATDQRYRTIALPAVSSGIFGFPKDRCARIFWKTTADWLRDHPESSLAEVRFTLIDNPTVEAFRQAWQERNEQ
jgi:O-acetyl-ADP-ribose deacetylase (regulator of RNase III)